MPPSGDISPNAGLSRQAVHMLVGALALLLRWLSYPQALALAAGLIVFNLLLLPRLPGATRYLYRADERARGFSAGILLYPVSVFLLILAFPMPVAAAMWGALACGDGMAGAVGTRVGRRRLPWNRRKSLEGLLAFTLAAVPAVALLYWWTVPNMSSSPPWWRSERLLSLFGSPDPGTIVLVSLITGSVCAFLETLRLKIDDNLVAPLGGACAMAGLVYVLCG